MVRKSNRRGSIVAPALVLVVACSAPDPTKHGPRPASSPEADAGEKIEGPVLGDEDRYPEPPPRPDAGPAPDPNAKVSFPTIDYAQNDIESLTGLSEDQCWNSCLAENDCVGVVLGTGADEGKCWTKKRFALGAVDALRTTIMRQTEPLTSFVKVKAGVTIAGAPIATSTADAHDCAIACNANLQCAGFVVKSVNKECLLFTAVVDGAACTDCIRYCNQERGGCPP